MKMFKHIDDISKYPKKTQHVDHTEVYRAVRSIDELKVEDFLPWNVEHANQRRTFQKYFKPGDYGVSLFTDLDTLKQRVIAIPSLNKRTNAYAKGFTTIHRGISLEESADHHVDYFLYDYENNSPKDDFCIIEVR